MPIIPFVKTYSTIQIQNVHSKCYYISCIYVPTGSCNEGDMHKALKGKGSSGRQFLVSMTLPLEHSAYCVHVNTRGTQNTL